MIFVHMYQNCRQNCSIIINFGLNRIRAERAQNIHSRRQTYKWLDKTRDINIFSHFIFDSLRTIDEQPNSLNVNSLFELQYRNTDYDYSFVVIDYNRSIELKLEMNFSVCKLVFCSFC